MENLKEQLRANKIEFTEIKTGNNRSQSAFQFTTLTVPINVVNDIKATTKLDVFTVSGEKNFSEKILRCKKLIFQPNGHLNWDVLNFSSADFIAISADELILNAPPDIGELAKLNLIYNGAIKKGDLGIAGNDGYSSPYANGEHGGHGTIGNEGGIGGTYNYPHLFIFYGSIKINTANPTILTGLSVKAIGFKGGEGGKGGRGGNGGNGATGTAGSAGGWPIKFCTGGPGRGGNAGYPAQGGKGGKAGAGGNGASISFVGSSVYYSKIEHIDFLLNKGLVGEKGVSGDDGTSGNVGGGGSRPFECPNGGGNGNNTGGNIIINPNKGSGESNSDGKDGLIFLEQRDNSDL